MEINYLLIQRLHYYILMIHKHDLNSVYSKSKLSIIDDAGHSLLENGITRKIIEIFSKSNELIS